jgi:hypothetical protein
LTSTMSPGAPRLGTSAVRMIFMGPSSYRAVEV